MKTLGTVLAFIFVALLYIAVSLATLALTVFVVVWVLQKMDVL